MAKDDEIAKKMGLVPLDEALGKLPESKVINVEVAQQEKADIQSKLNDDYNFARTNLRDLIEIGMTVAADAASVAQQSADANTYASVAKVITSMVDANQKLLNLTKQKYELTPEPAEQAEKPGNITNNLFVGSTSELQKMIEERQKK